MRLDYLFGLGAVLVVGFIAIVFLARRDKDLSKRSPDSILKEVEVLLAYGRDNNAVELLEKAKAAYPDDEKITRKLADLARK